MNIHMIMASLSFPIWIRITHYITLLFIGLLIRSGIQIAGAHPRLYWNDGSNPKRAWLNLVRKKVPKMLAPSLGDGRRDRKGDQASWQPQGGGRA